MKNFIGISLMGLVLTFGNVASEAKVHKENSGVVLELKGTQTNYVVGGNKTNMFVVGLGYRWAFENNMFLETLAAVPIGSVRYISSKSHEATLNSIDNTLAKNSCESLGCVDAKNLKATIPLTAELRLGYAFNRFKPFLSLTWEHHILNLSKGRYTSTGNLMTEQGQNQATIEPTAKFKFKKNYFLVGVGCNVQLTDNVGLLLQYQKAKKYSHHSINKYNFDYKKLSLGLNVKF